MKIYIDEQKKYEDTKSTAWCFTGVGVAGLIAVVLLDTGIIKLEMLDSANKIMMSIVMGLVFLIFFIIGIKSFTELKGISKKAQKNSSLENEITELVLKTYKNELESLKTDGREASGDMYYQRAELITSFITENYTDLSEDFLDHMVEKIYSEIYSDIVD